MGGGRLVLGSAAPQRGSSLPHSSRVVGCHGGGSSGHEEEMGVAGGSKPTNASSPRQQAWCNGQ